MGINARDAQLILRLRQEGHIPDQARIAELGAQQISHDLLASRDLLSELGSSFGAKGAPPLPMPGRDPEFDGVETKLDARAPFARAMWQWLGFDYSAIDIDDTPGSLPLDLNFDEVPTAERDRYHLVTNYGTTEHVANQMNAFKIAHDLTTPGGIMIHNLPCQGNLRHGLINYSPKFFWMLSRSNDYQWLYFNYVISDNEYFAPQDIIEGVAEFDLQAAERMSRRSLSNSALVVALKKVRPARYVAPVDVPNGATTRNKALLDRYPTVFSAPDDGKAR